MPWLGSMFFPMHAILISNLNDSYCMSDVILISYGYMQDLPRYSKLEFLNVLDPLFLHFTTKWNKYPIFCSNMYNMPCLSLWKKKIQKKIHSGPFFIWLIKSLIFKFWNFVPNNRIFGPCGILLFYTHYHLKCLWWKFCVEIISLDIAYESLKLFFIEGQCPRFVWKTYKKSLHFSKLKMLSIEYYFSNVCTYEINKTSNMNVPLNF
jgi:hypothetical protein